MKINFKLNQLCIMQSPMNFFARNLFGKNYFLHNLSRFFHRFNCQRLGELSCCVEKQLSKVSQHSTTLSLYFYIFLTLEHVKGISKSAPPIKRNPKGLPSSLTSFTSTTIFFLFCLNFLFSASFSFFHCSS